MTPYFFDPTTVAALAVKAGNAVMEIYEQDFAVYEKDDASPVTEADLTSEKIIFEGLKALTPDIPVIGEEHVAAGEVPDLTQRFFWLVDPIDGTADFVKKNGEFTVNIALIDENIPVFGAVYVPVRRELYYTVSPTQAVVVKNGETTQIRTRPVPADGLTVLTSRTHRDENVIKELLGQRPVTQTVLCGSSLKFCRLAAGEGDIYPCSHATKEWDTGAAHAVLKAAGGNVFDKTGAELTYRKTGLKNPVFIAFSQPVLS